MEKFNLKESIKKDPRDPWLRKIQKRYDERQEFSEQMRKEFKRLAEGKERREPDALIPDCIAARIAEEIYNILTPQKPRVYDSVPHARCPHCGRAFRVYCSDGFPKKCKWCGQLIDWNGIK